MSHDMELNTCPWPRPATNSVATLPSQDCPNPLTDLSGWLDCSLMELESRFASFMTERSLERDGRSQRSRRESLGS